MERLAARPLKPLAHQNETKGRAMMALPVTQGDQFENHADSCFEPPFPNSLCKAWYMSMTRLKNMFISPSLMSGHMVSVF
jgi:hypothetical protein